MKGIIQSLLGAVLIFALGVAAAVAVNRATTLRCVVDRPGEVARELIVFRVIVPGPDVRCENFAYRPKGAP